MQKIELHIVGGASGTEVFLDGKKVEKVRKLTLIHEVGHAPTLELEVFARRLSKAPHS